MKQFSYLLIFPLLIAGLAPFARPTLAATKTPVTYTTSGITVVSPGVTSVTGNTLHIRGEIDVGSVTGDLEGTIILVDDAVDINLTTGAGHIQGTFVLTTATVTWNGTFTQAGLNPASGLFEGHGTDGSTLLGRFFPQANGTALSQGTIIGR